MDFLTQNTYEVASLIESGMVSSEEVEYYAENGIIDANLLECIVDDMLAEAEAAPAPEATQGVYEKLGKLYSNGKEAIKGVYKSVKDTVEQHPGAAGAIAGAAGAAALGAAGYKAYKHFKAKKEAAKAAAAK